VANGVPRLELSGIVTDEGVIFTSGSGAGLQPEHVPMHIKASNVPANCFTLRSSQTGDEPHFRPARVFRRALTPLAGRLRQWPTTRLQRAMMMDVDQAAKAMKEAEIEDFHKGLQSAHYRGMRVNQWGPGGNLV
jgi:hypothetical protein